MLVMSEWPHSGEICIYTLRLDLEENELVDILRSDTPELSLYMVLTGCCLKVSNFHCYLKTVGGEDLWC